MLTLTSSAAVVVVAVPAELVAGPAARERPGDPPARVAEDSSPVEDEDVGNELADLSLVELMNVQVVVTASRREESARTVPYAMSIITAADIRASGARSVPDALRLAAGVDVADLSYGQAAVSPRGLYGFLARGALVLVDGRQIFDSLFGGTVWNSWGFQLEDIQRIEVIRGPGGVTWGANALNGVINIILKKPSDQLGTTLTLGGGSLGTHKEHVGYGVRDGPVMLHVSAEFEGSEGFHRRGLSLSGFDDDYKAARLSLRMVYEPDPDDRVELSAGSAVVDGGSPRSPLIGLGLNRNAESQASFVMGRWTRTLGADNQIEVTAYVNDFQVSPGAAQIDYRYQQLSLQIRQTFKPTDAHTFTWGVDTRTDLLDTTNSRPYLLSRGFVSTVIIGAYAQDVWRFAPKWTLGLGVRVDYESYGGFAPSARASLSREFDDGSFAYASISRAFAMPSVGLRFLKLPLLNGLVSVTGERDLDIESAVAYELGYRRKLFGKLDVDLTGFWQEYDDLSVLTPRLGPPGLLQRHLDGDADASLYGIELETRYSVNDKLTLLGNYTYQRLDWRSDLELRDKDLITPPANKAMLGVRYDASARLHLSSSLFFVDAVDAPNARFPFTALHVDPYLRWDLRGEYEFPEQDASIAVGVRNLLDGGHPEGGTLFIDSGESPRMVFAEFRLHIKPH